MRKSIRLLLVASVLYGTGAHWAALQGAAWASMISARVSESSWAEAVSATFSGEKPCGVCKFVEKGSTADKSSTFLRSGPSLELACSAISRLNDMLSVSTPVFLPPPSVPFLSCRPSVPPPKPLLA